MDRLIPGGIYTLSNEEHISYIFVREGRTGLIFFKLKTQYQNSKVIQNYINAFSFKAWKKLNLFLPCANRA